MSKSIRSQKNPEKKTIPISPKTWNLLLALPLLPSLVTLDTPLILLALQTPNYEIGGSNSCSFDPEGYCEKNNTINVLFAIKNKASINKFIVCHFMNVRSIAVSVQNQTKDKKKKKINVCLSLW